ncbi:CDP-alcohol phosphatidyltransferase family protein [Dechloromonas denitrificans]|uniref:CDP-alcohol phosphatidyltransferase family protein n=1 Tax=Dechloromonas denitrificans TaxID=281362 RepID=UPI001CFBB8B1|nr:CDP-alcohol phosphatidyltransferase family protein [Dechloromonas denitrificans]UCV06665.1 CDP-alcohol phosphatidyltransferase family protein [Dechloromonas denitrificans]
MSLFQQIFSDKFVNRAAISNNRLLLAMYRFAYPFALLLNRLGISPDQITTLSLLSAILAFFALVLQASVAWFCLFWGLAILLDFCDGTVARMSSRIATRAFRYDHMSDIFKMCIVVVGVAIRFDDKFLWIGGTTFLFVHLYSEIVSHDLKHALERSNTVSTAMSPVAKAVEAEEPRRLRDRVPAIRFVVTRLPFVYTLLQQFHVVLTTFNGHTLLVFLALPVGGSVTYVAMSYLTVLALRSCVNDIRTLWRMRR